MVNNESQTRSASYRLPALDQDFILGDSMRGVRFLLEYAKAEESLRNWGVGSTVVVFGSARVVPEETSDGAGTAPLPPGAAPRSGRRASWWYEQARHLGRIVSLRGGALTPINGVRHNVIATGGGPGIMEAVNRGANDVGAPSIGFNIKLPMEQGPNAYSTPDLTFQFHYFAMRKMHLAMRARALVVFPGGFGTLDELFELLTLVQTRKAPPLPIFCFDKAYWTRIINFDALIEEGMIAREDMGLIHFVEDAEAAWNAMVAAGLEIPKGTAG